MGFARVCGEQAWRLSHADQWASPSGTPSGVARIDRNRARDAGCSRKLSRQYRYFYGAAAVCDMRLAKPSRTS